MLPNINPRYAKILIEYQKTITFDFVNNMLACETDAMCWNSFLRHDRYFKIKLQ